MPRRTRASLTAALASAALLVAACGGAATPSLSDPAEIIAESVEAIQDTTSVHVRADLEGEVPFDLGELMSGDGDDGDDPGTSSSLDISGTTIDLDVDVDDEALRMIFVIPALLNLEGELIVVDEAAYVKASLLGEKYQRFEAADAGDLLPIPSLDPGSSASPDPSAMLQDIRDALAELDTPPVKLADETCGDATCYHLRIEVDQDDAESLGSFAPDVAGTATIDYFVRTNDLKPAVLTITADAGADGTFTATLTFSAWDADLTISAPPEDQVEEGTLPGLDGLTG